MNKTSTKKQAQNREWAILVALSLLVILLRWPSLEQPFDNDSGAIAYHARLIARGEPLYGTHHPAHHLPAVYYTYALAFLLFGDSVWAVKFLLILWTIAAAYLLYRMGTLLMDRATGLLAALFYIILSSNVDLFGTTAEIEQFANLPRVAAVWAIVRLTSRRRAASWKFVFVGLLSAGAFLFKAVYLSPLAMVCYILLLELWRNKKSPDSWKETLMRGTWVGLGFVTGLSLVAVYFATLGLLPRLLLVFTLGQEYVTYRIVNSFVFRYWALLPFIGLGKSNIVLLVCSLGGFVAMILAQFRRHRSGRGRGVSQIFFVSTWYILSFLEASITRVYYLHYYLLIVPPLALLAAWFLSRFFRLARNQARSGHRLIAGAIPVLLIIIATFSNTRQNTFYYLYAQYKLGSGTYRDFVVDGWPVIGPELVRVQKLADYVQEHTLPSDHVYYWSGGVQVYYLADRRCPIDIIWPLYIEATGPHQRIFTPRTKYIIVGESNNIPRPVWLYPELAENGYALETIVEGQEIYRRVD